MSSFYMESSKSTAKCQPSHHQSDELKDSKRHRSRSQSKRCHLRVRHSHHNYSCQTRATSRSHRRLNRKSHFSSNSSRDQHRSPRRIDESHKQSRCRSKSRKSRHRKHYKRHSPSRYWEHNSLVDKKCYKLDMKHFANEVKTGLESQITRLIGPRGIGETVASTEFVSLMKEYNVMLYSQMEMVQAQKTVAQKVQRLVAILLTLSNKNIITFVWILVRMEQDHQLSCIKEEHRNLLKWVKTTNDIQRLLEGKSIRDNG